jgi:hypothetical protein
MLTRRDFNHEDERRLEELGDVAAIGSLAPARRQPQRSCVLRFGSSSP